MSVRTERLIQNALSYAHNPIVSRLLKLFPEKVFQKLHEWPARFSWTEKNVSFCLSFDCDNPTDAEALPALLSMLQTYDLSASFAVCGAVVKENVDAYRLIIAKGHEIINHGYSKHVEVHSDGMLYPAIFYENMSAEQIENEIVQNHECLQKVLGTKPVGFRVPHFGTFQKKDNIALLYFLLSKHGYRYSSSVQMIYAKQRGYLDERKNIAEFPLSARVGIPLSVFDSWGFLEKSSRKLKEKSFFSEFQSLVDSALKSQRPIFLNVYFDPSHLVECEGFEKCLSYLHRRRDKIWIGRYSDALPKLES